MGQGKEASQVATKYAISDLWKEVVVWDAMPSPLVALTIIVNKANYHVATLQSLARYLSITAKKSLLAQFKPLAYDPLPEPTNLLAW